MNAPSEAAGKTKAPPIRALVPMIHVADVEKSVGFYRLLGFEVGNRFPPEGRLNWVWLYAPAVENWKEGPNLMLTCGEREQASDEQDALFYLYATDLVTLRDHLLAHGVQAGEICYPEYLPKGEFKLLDPDGYLLMIAQAGPDTP